MTETPQSLSGRTLFITGGSRGIGLAIATRAAQDGVTTSRSLRRRTHLTHNCRGTVHTHAATIEDVGRRALPIVGDIRDENAVASAVQQTYDHFGGIDILINNASATTLQGVGGLPLKRYDLMQDISVRGTFVVNAAVLPHLLESSHAHVWTLSQLLNLDDDGWLNTRGMR